MSLRRVSLFCLASPRNPLHWHASWLGACLGRTLSPAFPPHPQTRHFWTSPPPLRFHLRQTPRPPAPLLASSMQQPILLRPLTRHHLRVCFMPRSISWLAPLLRYGPSAAPVIGLMPLAHNPCVPCVYSTACSGPLIMAGLRPPISLCPPSPHGPCVTPWSGQRKHGKVHQDKPSIGALPASFVSLKR